jgi:6,7-dimethyl-8-ribityllumazine synthase
MSDIKNQYRIAVLTTSWNSFITDNLLNKALDALTRNGVSKDNIDVIRVPGAFELPLAAQQVLKGSSLDAIVALGCVIRGGTPHFDYVCRGCMDGLMRVQLDTGVPITFGVLTVDNVDQAIERSGDNPNNKGEEAALTALEMIRLVREKQS